MSRLALLIEASKIKDHTDLPGAREDIDAYKSFLASDFGGAWDDKEIQVLSHPKKQHLMAWVQAAGVHDYSFIAFSGHGHHFVGKGINETRVCINDTEEVAVYDLNSGSSRCLVIADACRRITVLPLEKYAKSFQLSLIEAEDALEPNRKRCRDLFDQCLEQAEKGAIYMYSCDLHEAAADSNSFSRALVGVGEAWAERRTQGCQRSDEAFASAAALTTSKNKQQHPKSDPGRRRVHFPFTVLAY